MMVKSRVFRGIWLLLFFVSDWGEFSNTYWLSVGRFFSLWSPWMFSNFCFLSTYGRMGMTFRAMAGNFNLSIISQKKQQNTNSCFAVKSLDFGVQYLNINVKMGVMYLKVGTAFSNFLLLTERELFLIDIS